MSAYAKKNIEDAYILINVSLFLSREVQVPSKYLKGKKKKKNLRTGTSS